MSDARGDFFASGAESKSAPTKSLDRSGFFSGDWEPDEVKPAPRAHEFRFDPAMLDDPEISSGMGAAEAGLHAASATAGQAVGGVTGIGTLLQGGSTEDAEKNIDWWKQALTYQPRTEAGQGATDVGAHVLANATAPLQAVKEYAGDSAEAAGWGPLASAAMSVAPDALLSLTGAPGMPKGGISVLASDARLAASKAAEPVANLVKRAGKAMERTDLPPSAPPTEPTFGADTLSSAAAAPDLTRVSSRLQSATREAARETGGAVNREVFDRQAQADRLGLPALTEGQATQDLKLISDERNSRSTNTAYADHFNAQNRAMVDKLDEFRAEASPSVVHMDPVQKGQTLIDEYKAHDAPVKQAVDDAYASARAMNGGDLPMDAQSFVTKLDATKNTKAKFLPSDVAAELQQWRAGEPMNFEQFEDFRTTLANAARKARAASDGNAAHAIGAVRRALEETEPVGVAKDVKAAFDKARALNAQRMSAVESDPAYAAAMDDDVPMGQASTLADKFVDKYVIRGSTEHVRRMSERLGSSDTAREVMAGSTLDYLKDKGVSSGKFGQKSFNGAARQLESKLDSLLGRQMHENITDLGEYAHNAMSQPEGHWVNNSNTTPSMMREAAKNVAEHGANVVAHGVPVGTVVRKVGSYISDKRAAAAEAKRVQKSLSPGAGLTRLRDVLQAPKK